jgi:hypothetical protein
VTILRPHLGGLPNDKPGHSDFIVSEPCARDSSVRYRSLKLQASQPPTDYHSVADFDSADAGEIATLPVWTTKNLGSSPQVHLNENKENL